MIAHDRSSNSQSTNIASDVELESIASEYAELLEKGESIAPELFAARYPHRGNHLLELLKSIRWIQLAARDLDDQRTKASSTTAPGSYLFLNGDKPTVLGDFRLIREIGRGGMGIVYEGEQISLSRRVAVKILPPSSFLDERQVARFAMESQAAAQLQHPNIVPVFAVGCENGIYFYSMQLIDGNIPKGVMPPGQVADLGACVANALEHSHELGIIHRDVKPSNLLIDVSGKVWITDFGLARCRQSDQVTVSGAVLGTLSYMSPEQALGSSTVDHRTDIYSLGVTLYELLTGRCPYDSQNRSAFLTELARGEPIEIRKLDPSIPIDLETIVHKAMSNDPTLRYPTARSMADDLVRFTKGEVVLARRPTLIDRMAKWVSRNRRWVMAAAVMWSLVSMAALFAVILLWKAGNENRKALDQTKRSLEEADAFFSQAREVVDHFGISLSKQLATVPGAETTRRQILQDTLRYYRNFMAQAERNPLRQREVARTYMKLGRVAEQMDAFDEAVESYARSEEIWRKISPIDPERALCANLLGLLQSRMGKVDAADKAFEIAVQCNERMLSVEPNNWEARRRYALALTNRSVSNSMRGDSHPEVAMLQKALSIQQKLLLECVRDDETRLEILVDTGKTYGALAAACRETDPAMSQSHSRQCIVSFESAFQQSIESPDEESSDIKLTKEQASEDLVMALCNHAAILNDCGDVSQAIQTLVKCTELGMKLCNDHPTPNQSLNLAAAYNMLARLYANQNKPEEQLESFQRASQILVSLVQKNESEVDYRVDLAAVCFNIHNTAQALSASAVASAAKEELRTQLRWMREHAPSGAHQIAELLEKIQPPSSTL